MPSATVLITSATASPLWASNPWWREALNYFSSLFPCNLLWLSRVITKAQSKGIDFISVSFFERKMSPNTFKRRDKGSQREMNERPMNKSQVTATDQQAELPPLYHKWLVKACLPGKSIMHHLLWSDSPKYLQDLETWPPSWCAASAKEFYILSWILKRKWNYSWSSLTIQDSLSHSSLLPHGLPPWSTYHNGMPEYSCCSLGLWLYSMLVKPPFDLMIKAEVSTFFPFKKKNFMTTLVNKIR